MGKRYITGVEEVELTDAAGEGFLAEVSGTYYYDSNNLEIEYVYNLETGNYVDETKLTKDEMEYIINSFCKSGTYYDEDDVDRMYSAYMDK